MQDYFSSKEECDKYSRDYRNTNPRYKNFCQKYFTAGDEDQFQSSRDFSNSKAQADEGVCHTDFQFDIWSGYSQLSGDAVSDTFSYIFHKFKKGIYIRIKENKVTTFLPFSKAKFLNEWGDRIQVHPKYKSVVEFMRHINQMEGRPFNEKRVNKFTDEWYANNCLLRYEFPLSEGDTGTSHMKNMFEELCANRKVPDLELFVNRRDFPLLKRDGTEPYHHIYDSPSVPLLSHKYEKYCPIFSCVNTPGFADIAIPTIDDWARVKAYEGAFFEKTQSRQYKGDFDIDWASKKPIAVFRGGSTGAGTTIQTNPRLKAAYISSLNELDPADNLPYLDAGITEWNLRPRKMQGEKYLQTIEINSLPFSLVPRLSPQEQAGYKYIVHIQGHVAAFRLSLELSMGSTILLVESEYSLWFIHLLKPFVHYIPVKSDLSDLIDTIKWCKENDDKCKEIAQNAKTFFKKYLQKDGIFDYLQALLYKTKSVVGNYLYPEVMPIEAQLEKESTWVYANCSLHLNLEKKLVLRTKHTDVYESGEFIFKKSDRQKELLRDVFIFQNGLKGLQNFCEVFGVDGEYVVYKKCSGKTLFEWLKTDFNLKKFIQILLQLCLAIGEAQDRCGFVHNDLFPWNVMIDGDKITIIDYGKSHIVFSDVHHGFINPFAMGSMYDIMCIILSSVAVVIKERALTRADEDALVNLVNFFAHSRILPHRLTSFPKMRHFVFTHSSFSTLCSIDKFDNRTPADFVAYISNKNSKEDSTRNLIQRPIKKILPKMKFKSRFLVYYFFQTLNDPNLETEFKNYLRETDEVAVNVESLGNEFFLNKKKVLNELNRETDVTCFEEMIAEKDLILSYRGVFEVTERDRLNYMQFTKFKLLQIKANRKTSATFM